MRIRRPQWAPPPVRGVDGGFSGAAGSEAYMRAQSGLDAGALAEAARELLAP